MTPTPTSARPRARVWVDIHNPQQIRYWTEQFQCTSRDLEKAVTAVGIMASRVENWLEGRISTGAVKPAMNPFKTTGARGPSSNPPM